MKTKGLEIIQNAKLEITVLDNFILCEMKEYFFKEGREWSFYLPLKAAQKPHWFYIPKSLIDYRMKRDFGIFVEHYSVMYKLNNKNY